MLVRVLRVTAGRLARVGLASFVFASCAATSGSIVNEMSGEVTTLEKLRGRVVVLNFWADWCGPCVTELPLLTTLVEEAGADVVLLPVYYEDRPSRRSGFHAWLANQPAYFRNRVCFADPIVREAHSLERIPLTVVYGRDGTIVESFVGSVVPHPERLKAAIARGLEQRAPPAAK